MGLSGVFDKIREDNRAAFIGCCPAGFPAADKSVENIKAVVGAGTDITEAGLPFSDPMMDGPTIQGVADVALDAGFRTRKITCMVREITEHGDTCVVVSYWNPILQYGPERFVGNLVAAGGRGATIPDLIPEEVGQWQRAAGTNGLSNTVLVAPSSTNGCLQLIATASTGFVYAASHMGVTGAWASVDSAAGKLVARMCEVTDTPVCIGLGVSNGEQATEIAEFIDGIIVGSALIKATMKSTDDLVALTRELAAGVRGEN